MTVCQEKRHHFSDFMGLGMGASGRLGEVGGGGGGGGGEVDPQPNPENK